jgi:hypothetical protein
MVFLYHGRLVLTNVQCLAIKVGSFPYRTAYRLFVQRSKKDLAKLMHEHRHAKHHAQPAKESTLRTSVFFTTQAAVRFPSSASATELSPRQGAWLAEPPNEAEVAIGLVNDVHSLRGVEIKERKASMQTYVERSMSHYHYWDHSLDAIRAKLRVVADDVLK